MIQQPLIGERIIVGFSILTSKSCHLSSDF